MACSMLSLQVMVGMQLKSKMHAEQQAAPPPDAFINIHPRSNFAVLPPTVCSAWSSSASRLKPINISDLINK